MDAPYVKALNCLDACVVLWVDEHCAVAQPVSLQQVRVERKVTEVVNRLERSRREVVQPDLAGEKAAFEVVHAGLVYPRGMLLVGKHCNVNVIKIAINGVIGVAQANTSVGWCSLESFLLLLWRPPANSQHRLQPHNMPSGKVECMTFPTDHIMQEAVLACHMALPSCLVGCSCQAERRGAVRAAERAAREAERATKVEHKRLAELKEYKVIMKV
jgi:hypothetical protein